MDNFHHTESYAHLYAKKVMAEWLREKWVSQGVSQYYIFQWSAPADPDKGVKIEYPIISREIQSEQDNPAKKEILGIHPIWTTYPDLDKVQENGRKIESVLDIALCHEGKIRYAIEIVYKHRTPPHKIKFLKEQGIESYEISALWILNQTRRPAKLELISL